MLNSGLPKILESTLDNILSDMIVSSWNVRGEDDTMHLYIRFKSNMEAPTSLDRASVSYRRIPPSQVKRNSERAKAWHNRDIKCDNSESTTDTGFSIDNTSNEDTTIECAFINTPSSEVPAYSSIESNPSETQPTTASNSTESNIVTSQSPIQENKSTGQVDKGNNQDTLKPKQYDTNRRILRSSTSRTKVKPFRYRNVSVDLKCARCKQNYVDQPPSKTFLCTYCPAFVCDRCINIGHHSHHSTTLKGPFPLDEFYERYCK